MSRLVKVNEQSTRRFPLTNVGMTFGGWQFVAIWLLFVPMLLSFVSCKPQVPSEYLSPGEMEDILYDYHLSMSIAQSQSNQVGERDMTLKAYQLAVLEKYGVTEKEFDESMEYYMRHTERMHDIYERLAKRLSDEALAQGASTSEVNQYSSVTATGDTANVWTGAKALVLFSKAPFNSYSFALKADTAYHQGDNFILTFDSQYIIQEGSRDGVAVLAVRFANDSVASRVQRVSGNMNYKVTVQDSRRLGIKEVRGFLMLSPSSYSSSSTTLSLLCVSNIKLIRIHQKKPQPTTEQPSSSMSTPNPSSLLPDNEVTRVPPEKKDSSSAAKR